MAGAELREDEEPLRTEDPELLEGELWLLPEERDAPEEWEPPEECDPADEPCEAELEWDDPPPRGCAYVAAGAAARAVATRAIEASLRILFIRVMV